MFARNVNLNPGGFIGAGLGAVIGAAIGFLLFGVQKEAIGGGGIKGLVVFAVAGNICWEWLFRKQHQASGHHQLHQELQLILDEFAALNRRATGASNDDWEDWARRSSLVADRCDVAGFPDGAANLRWLVHHSRGSIASTATAAKAASSPTASR